MPAARKPPALRQNTITRDTRLIARDGEPVVPPMPAGRWLKSTREDWDRLHRSEIAQVIQPLDGALLLHWVRCVDERERAFRLFSRERIVDGSRGQPRISPAWKLYADLSNEIRMAEQQLGIGGLNRYRLGITMGQAHQAMNAVMAGGEPELVQVDDDYVEVAR